MLTTPCLLNRGTENMPCWDVDEYPLAIAQSYIGGEPRGNGSWKPFAVI